MDLDLEGKEGDGWKGILPLLWVLNASMELLLLLDIIVYSHTVRMLYFIVYMDC